VAAFRLAWAMAVDEAPPISFLPQEFAVRRSWWRPAAALAAVAAFLVVSSYYPGSPPAADRDAPAGEPAAAEPPAAAPPVAAASPPPAPPPAPPAPAAPGAAGTADPEAAPDGPVALEAFDAQGPDLARLLDEVAHATPPEVTLSALTATPRGMGWQVALSGRAESVDPASAHAAVEALRLALDAPASPGVPVRAVSVRSLAAVVPAAGPAAASLAFSMTVEVGAPAGMDRAPSDGAGPGRRIASGPPVEDLVERLAGRAFAGEERVERFAMTVGERVTGAGPGAAAAPGPGPFTPVTLAFESSLARAGRFLRELPAPPALVAVRSIALTPAGAATVQLRLELLAGTDRHDRRDRTRRRRHRHGRRRAARRIEETGDGR
jgi:hypothetical protein